MLLERRLRAVATRALCAQPELTQRSKGPRSAAIAPVVKSQTAAGQIASCAPLENSAASAIRPVLIARLVYFPDRALEPACIARPVNILPLAHRLAHCVQREPFLQLAHLSATLAPPESTRASYQFLQTPAFLAMLAHSVPPGLGFVTPHALQEPTEASAPRNATPAPLEGMLQLGRVAAKYVCLGSIAGLLRHHAAIAT